MLKLASHWMPARHFAFASGVALFTGVLCATLAGAPLRGMVDAFGWRPVMLASAAVTAAVALAIWLVVRDDPVERGYASYSPGHGVEAGSMMSQLAQVLRYRNTWLLFLIPGAFSGIILTFAGLWGVPYLTTVHGFSLQRAALTCTAMLVAWSFASMAYGPASERIGRRKPLYLAGLVSTLASWSVVVWVPSLSPGVLVALLLVVSVSSAAFIVTFAFAKESVPARVGGTASGIANMGVMVGGMVMQPLVGFILDAQWRGGMAGGVRVYDFEAYQRAFACMLAWGVVSLLLIAFTRETRCRPLTTP
jgi:predicted MFS family arabinose efflux permease